ncbi:MAG: type II toxin-antitoxin system RelB/DinJ family antitoxin [Candidatus Levybacteria bacterium]|nr:type II toxin-antitoxin system RelB/DinJ family antitoxin [Candidatus Levybacteria bacterium]
MSTTAIYIKTETTTKKQAQQVARELGLSLSAIVNGFLKQFIKTKTVTFSANDEIPNARTQAILKQAEKNWKEGKGSPIFETGEEAVKWLEKQGI